MLELWEIIKPLIIFGFFIGIFFTVVFAGIKLGLKLAPWAMLIALVVVLIEWIA
jgi:hypothetical protein